MSAPYLFVRKRKKEQLHSCSLSVILSRFELLTFRLGGGRSIQLSYRIDRVLSTLDGNLAYFSKLDNRVETL